MFEITIKEKRTERKLVPGTHTVIEKRPFTDEELSKSSAYRTLYETKPDVTELKPIYGYAPAREENVTTEREILTQVVDELDLAAVIRAINKL